MPPPTGRWRRPARPASLVGDMATPHFDLMDDDNRSGPTLAHSDTAWYGSDGVPLGEQPLRSSPGSTVCSGGADAFLVTPGLPRAAPWSSKEALDRVRLDKFGPFHHFGQQLVTKSDEMVNKWGHMGPHQCPELLKQISGHSVPPNFIDTWVHLGQVRLILTLWAATGEAIPGIPYFWYPQGSDFGTLGCHIGTLGCPIGPI